MDDRALVKATLGGNREGFTQLVRKYQSPLVASACHIINNRDDAEDLAQDSFITAYAQLHTLREHDKFAGWLFTILRTKCLRYLQRHRKNLSLEEFRDTLAAPPPPDDSALLDALWRLPLQDREILAARYLHGLEYDEVATALGINIEAARMRCLRARERLRELMLEADEERTRLLMQRAMSLMLVGGISDTFTDRVLREVKKMRNTKMPHKANSTTGNTAAWGTMHKVGAGILTVAVLAGAGIVWHMFGTGSKVSPAEMKQAFSEVQVIHMNDIDDDIARTTEHKRHVERWVRLNPYLVYEEITPINPTTPKKASAHIISVSSADTQYFYYPERGNRLVICPGSGEMPWEQMLNPQQFKVTGQGEFDGKRVTLVTSDFSGMTMELAIDPDTKRTCRMRMLDPNKGEKPGVGETSRITYNETPPAGVFDWQPPAGVTIERKGSKVSETTL